MTTGKTCVLGGGSWGATIASHLAKKGQKVYLWEFSEDQVRRMKETRKLSFLPQLHIPESVLITSVMAEALEGSDAVFSTVPSQFVRSTWFAAKKYAAGAGLIVSLSKGIETETLKRMTEVIIEEFPGAKDIIAAVSGPSHAEEVATEIPTAVVVASRHKIIAETALQMLGTKFFRVYTNPDVVGVELGGALKNIFAIACGVCDGIKMGDNTKAALVTRGLHEMSRLGMRMGGKQSTFSGLSGMGDLVVTCFSQYSRNRLLGEKIGQGKNATEALKEMTMVAEGYPTSRSAHGLAQKYGCECPIINEIYQVLYDGKNARKSVQNLMDRPMRTETEEAGWE